MASQQGNKETQPQEPRVPKQLAHHFEELAEQVKESDKAIGEGGHAKDSTVKPGAVKVDVIAKEVSGGKDVDKEAQKGEYSHSVEDIGRYRAQAQQNSMETIRGAEERYAKAKEAALSGQKGVKVGENQEEQGIEEGQEEYIPGKETTVTVGKTVIDHTKQAAEQAKDIAAAKGGPAVNYIDEKAVEAKDIALHATKNAAGYAGEKAVAAKDTAIDCGKKAAGYTGEKAVQAKGTTVEVGKSVGSTTVEVGKQAAGYVGSKVVQAKDVAVETGLRAAHYTLEKAAELTEATAGYERKAAELTAGKAEAARREAMKKEQEAKESAEEVEGAPKFDEYKGESGIEGKPAQVEQGESLIGAVGETLVEIGETTKKLVIGSDPEQK